MSFSRKCHPHFCPFDSPACPDKCNCECKKIKPNCVSVTAQEAMNISPLRVESKKEVRQRSFSSRERIFGMPYDQKRDTDLPTITDDAIKSFLRHNLDYVENTLIQPNVSCCQVTCECSNGPDCKCRKKGSLRNAE